jgi:hypothetical protein
MQVFDLAPTFVPMLVEPEPPAVGVAQSVVTGDERRHQHEAVPVCGCRESPVVQDVVVRLLAAVKGHDHRSGCGKSGGNIDLVRALARSREVPGSEREGLRGAGFNAWRCQSGQQDEEKDRGDR